MGYTDVTEKIVNYKDKKPGDVLIEDGVYVGTDSKEVQGTKMTNFVFTVQGEKTALYGCGALKYALEQGKMIPGAKYRIIYEGQGVMDSGLMKGKPFHKVKIQVDTTGAETHTVSQDALPF